MNMRHSLLPFVLLALCLASAPPARAAERVIRTVDGQTFQGEDLGTENGILKLQTKYAIQEIPTKDIVSSKVVPAPKAAPVEEPEAETKEEKAVPPPPPPPSATPAPTTHAPAPAVAAPVRPFPEPKAPDLSTLLRAQAAHDRFPEPDKKAYLEIERCIRNFGDTNAAGRRRIVTTLRGYGRVAQPAIAAAYTGAADLDLRVDLLEALAVPGRPDTAGLFMETHRAALSALNQAATAPPLPPPDSFIKSERQRPQRQADVLRAAAQDVLDLENFASIAGGPYNALFLLDLYKKRYSDDKSDPLLSAIKRDGTRLAATAADAGRSRSSWGPGERVMLAELVLPMLFKDNSDLQSLAQDFLKKLLPTGHPKWDAEQDEWVEWWEKAKTKIR